MGPLVGHVHFADSNRHAIGFGHTDMPPILRALADIGYSGYLSAEILPLPDGDTVGRTAAEKLPVHYVPSPVDAEVKVWRVELK